MSWWISLEHPETEECAEVEKFTAGGTYAIGGTDEATLNVTYNYGKHYDFKALNGLIAEKTIKSLEATVEELGTQKDDDYWASTPGNCGWTCQILLGWAKQHPTYVWRVN